MKNAAAPELKASAKLVLQAHRALVTENSFMQCVQITMYSLKSPSFFLVLIHIEWTSLFLFVFSSTQYTHQTGHAGKPPQTQNMYPTGRHLFSPLWLADLGVARTDHRQTGCYSSYVAMLLWPNKLRETIPAAGVSRKDHLLEWHDPSNYLNSADCG